MADVDVPRKHIVPLEKLSPIIQQGILSSTAMVDRGEGSK